MSRTCPKCFSYLKLNGKCPNCDYMGENKGNNGVWIFIIAYISIQFLIRCITYGIFEAFFGVIISWFPILIIPCVIRYGFKKVLLKKGAILYVVISGILFFIANCVIDILNKEINPQANTTTIWNLIMMITPYYILTDIPIFSKDKNKDVTVSSEQTNEKRVKNIKTKTIKSANFKKLFSFVLKRIKNYKGLSKNTTIIIVSLIIAFSYIYAENYKIVYKEKVRQETIKNDRYQQEQLDKCMADAETNYLLSWEKECKAIYHKKDCRLPEHNANTVEKWRINEEKQCMDKYKNKAFLKY